MSDNARLRIRELKPAAQKELFDLCERMWLRVRSRMARCVLKGFEWDDIRAVAIERVFSRIDQFDPVRGKLQTWVFVVMLNATKNEMRALIPDPKNPQHKWRADIRLAYTLRTRVKEIGPYGEEVVVVEPDTVAENVEPRLDPEQLDGFRKTLRKIERAAWDLALQGLNKMEIKRKLNLKTYSATCTLLRHLGNRWLIFRERSPSLTQDADVQKAQAF